MLVVVGLDADAPNIVPWPTKVEYLDGITAKMSATLGAARIAYNWNTTNGITFIVTKGILHMEWFFSI